MEKESTDVKTRSRFYSLMLFLRKELKNSALNIFECFTNFIPINREFQKIYKYDFVISHG